MYEPTSIASFLGLVGLGSTVYVSCIFLLNLGKNSNKAAGDDTTPLTNRASLLPLTTVTPRYILFPISLLMYM